MRANHGVAALILLVACGPSVQDPSLELTSLDIEPANATLTYTGTPVSLDYKAIGHYADGHTAEVPDATFSLDADGQRLGDLAVAKFAASGAAGGKGGVLAQAGSVTAGTSVVVVIHPVNRGPDVPADGADKFPDDPPMGALSPTVVYPLASAVMPSSVKAPDVQWEGASSPTDLYRVRLTAGPFATVDTILAVPTSGPFAFESQLVDAQWRSLVHSAGNGPITVTVAHWDATTGAQGGAPVQVRMIEADVTGALYYWNLGQGQMERIDAAGRAPAIPNPPPRPSEPGNHCVACHTVSHDGRYLAGSLWGGGLEGGVFDLSDPAIKTGNPAPTVAPVVPGSTYTQLFSTFNQDATRLMINAGTGLRVVDPKTGASIATAGTPLPTANAAHPAWSPDGTTVAFVNNITMNGQPAAWAVDYTRGDLQILPVTAPDTFGPPSNLVAAANVDPAFAAPSWPSFAPDSQWIAYGAGVNSRGQNTGTLYPGSLFVVNKAGGVTVRLDTACGGERRCYLPNFSPYDIGGYFWLVFYSFRDYGNVPAGTKGTGRRQMWITAIDKAKLAAGVDASAVPYWVPDQDVHTENMSAFWALPPPIQ